MRDSSNSFIFDVALTKATTIPAQTIRKYVDGVRRRNPECTPDQLLKILAKQYRNLMRTTGGAIGVSAAFPGVGTTTAIVLSAADVGGFLMSASIYSLAVADVHGIDVQDTERRKALLLTTLLGESGAKTVSEITGKPLPMWGTALLTSLPNSTIKQVNTVLTSRFVKRQLIKHTGLTMGRIIPFGVGALVGVAGGNGLANTVINQAQKAFGQAPAVFNRPLYAVIEHGPLGQDPSDLSELEILS